MDEERKNHDRKQHKEHDKQEKPHHKDGRGDKEPPAPEDAPFDDFKPHRLLKKDKFKSHSDDE